MIAITPSPYGILPQQQSPYEHGNVEPAAQTVVAATNYANPKPPAVGTYYSNPSVLGNEHIVGGGGGGGATNYSNANVFK